MKIKWRLLFILFIVSVLYMHCSAQDSYQPYVTQTIYFPSQKIYVYPNPLPANSGFNIEIDSSDNAYLARVIVYNLSNFIIKDEMVKVQKGDNKFQINMAGYNQGNYIVRIVPKTARPYFYSDQLVIQ
jgi:hypothetical protein